VRNHTDHASAVPDRARRMIQPVGPAERRSFEAAGTGNSANWLPSRTVSVADWAAGWPSGPDDSSRFAATLNGGPQGEVPGRLGPYGGNERWVTLDFNADQRTDFALIRPTEIARSKPG
jgi:hypothetical protein